MGKGDSKTLAKRKAMKQQRAEAKRAMSSDIALSAIPRRLRGKNRRRANKPAESRKIKPTPEQENRMMLLKGSNGDPNDPLAPAKAHGMLTEAQAEALHRYRQIANAYSRSVQAPHLAPDILASLEPIGASSVLTDDAAAQIKAAYIDAKTAMKSATRKQVDMVEWMVTRWGCTLNVSTCEALAYPADLLAAFWGIDVQNEQA